MELKGPVDVVLSDMSPNHSGDKDADCLNICNL
jgi:23S rRNA U2552 (ribose-2'-O)-methylase RlmE/FtsJ